MGFWSSLGKIGLQAAPYVAAPFTGGASLYAVPATQKLGQKWSEHDNAERAKKGLGPSSFDNILNQASGYVGMASSMGMPGISGGKYAPPNMRTSGGGQSTGVAGNIAGNTGIAGNIGGIIDQVMRSRGGGQSQDSGQAQEYSRGGGQNFRSDGTQGGQFGNYGGYMRGLGPVMGRRDQNNPNLAESIGAGRQDAMRNQPFRQGYDMISYGPESVDDSQGNIGPEIRTRMPPIYPTGSRRRRAS